MRARGLPAGAALLAFVPILISQPQRVTAIEAAPPRFAIRALQAQPAPARSGSGRFAVTAAAQVELAPSSQRRFNVKTALECNAGPGDTVLFDGFETP